MSPGTPQPRARADRTLTVGIVPPGILSSKPTLRGAMNRNLLRAGRRE
jgi:hypothetical protein